MSIFAGFKRALPVVFQPTYLEGGCWVEAMKKADTGLLKNCFSPSAVFQTIQDDKGVITIIEEKIAEFIDFVGKETVGAADEQIVIETVKIDGPMAMLWAPYKFYYKGKFSHCGVNSFQLIRLNTGWKIQYIIDSRRKDGICSYLCLTLYFLFTLGLLK